MSDLVENWFGAGFQELHPLIRQLHTHGGKLTGEITLSFGSGVAAILGKRMGNKLGLPENPGVYPFTVTISHINNELLWQREFPDCTMLSRFTPVGQYPDGYWKEETGFVEMQLGVDTKDGGWHWIQRQLIVKGVKLPAVFSPDTIAYKKIVDQRYEFVVQLSYKKLGTLVDYRGSLVAEVNS